MPAPSATAGRVFFFTEKITVKNLCGIVCALTLLAGGCLSPDKDVPKEEQDMGRNRPVNAVMDAHSKELMAIPGVTGVYVGLTDDGEDCIGVMADSITPALRKAVPDTIEGYPVRLEAGGPVRPMK